MSRIGKLPIPLPKDVFVQSPAKGIIRVNGPKGELQQRVDSRISVQVVSDTVVVSPDRGRLCQEVRALHGLYRALIHNMVVGVSIGFKRTLELVGVGYKANVDHGFLELNLGYSHDVVVVLPKEIVVETEVVKGKPPLIHLSCIDYQLLGQVAAKIRSLRKVEPYKGKGIRFLNEVIRRKVGKSTKK